MPTSVCLSRIASTKERTSNKVQRLKRGCFLKSLLAKGERKDCPRESPLKISDSIDHRIITSSLIEISARHESRHCARRSTERAWTGTDIWPRADNTLFHISIKEDVVIHPSTLDERNGTKSALLWTALGRFIRVNTSATGRVAAVDICQRAGALALWPSATAPKIAPRFSAPARHVSRAYGAQRCCRT